jgi:DNA-binding NarL/FixJ family response regulator
MKTLTKRETQVLGMMTGGKTQKETAYDLGISPATVNIHWTNLREKLEIWSLAKLTKYAIRNGITSLEEV